MDAPPIKLNSLMLYFCGGIDSEAAFRPGLGRLAKKVAPLNLIVLIALPLDIRSGDAPIFLERGLALLLISDCLVYDTPETKSGAVVVDQHQRFGYS